MDWNYQQPVKIYFGNGRLSALPELIGAAQRPFLISDAFFEKSGLLARIQEMTGGETFTDVSPNPDVTEVNRCSALLREQRADLIIAVGGGSVMDLAKAASVTVPDITEYHGTGKPVPEKAIPILAVPTTAGTGSEATNAAVLTNRTTGKKAPIVSDAFFPKIALIDPELTYSAPPAVTASCGIDVLCHAVEGYWSRGHIPVCDAIAVSAIRTVFRYLPIAYAEPENAEAREKMAEASLLGGLAFSLPKTTSSHACSFPLTSIYGIPHGEACGLTLDFFARVNGADPRTQALAHILGYADADAFADAILSLKRQTGLRTDLSDLHLTDTQIDELVQKSHHPNLLNNPVEITDEILYQLYHTLKG